MVNKMESLIPKARPRPKLEKRSMVSWNTSLNWRATESAIHITDDGIKTLCGVKIPLMRNISEFSGIRSYQCKKCQNKVKK